MAEILEHVIVKLFGIINCDFSRNPKMIDDILPEELLDYRRAYVGDWFCLDPLGKILDFYNGEGVIALSWS
jgi:hypothetical protein